MLLLTACIRMAQLRLSNHTTPGPQGAAIVLALARALPEYDFVAVAGAPQAAHAAAGIANLQIVPPAASVDVPLARMWVVLAPSLWLEAFGMVVVDAMLRGVPVLASDAGGLTEALLGTAPPIRVAHIVVLPSAAADGAPDWRLRQYPRQDIAPWAAALQHLLGNPAAYAAASAACRAAAHAFLEQGPAALASYLAVAEGSGGPGRGLAGQRGESWRTQARLC